MHQSQVDGVFKPQTQLCWLGLFLYISYRAMNQFNFSLQIMMSSPLCHSQAPKTLAALHLLKKLPQALHCPPDVTPCPPTSIKSLNSKTGSRSWQGSTLAKSPRKPPGQVSNPLGRSVTPQPGTGVWHSCCSSWNRGKPHFLREEQTAWPINSSVPSALSLARTSAHNNRTLSPQSSLRILELLKVTWNYCPGKDQRKTIKVGLF